MNTDTTATEVFLVWDHGREMKGEAPELLSVQATERTPLLTASRRSRATSGPTA